MVCVLHIFINTFMCVYVCVCDHTHIYIYIYMRMFVCSGWTMTHVDFKAASIHAHTPSTTDGDTGGENVPDSGENVPDSGENIPDIGEIPDPIATAYATYVCVKHNVCVCVKHNVCVCVTIMCVYV
jgi:hypothetical protein